MDHWFFNVEVHQIDIDLTKYVYNSSIKQYWKDILFPLIALFLCDKEV